MATTLEPNWRTIAALIHRDCPQWGPAILQMGEICSFFQEKQKSGELPEILNYVAREHCVHESPETYDPDVIHCGCVTCLARSMRRDLIPLDRSGGTQ